MLLAKMGQKDVGAFISISMREDGSKFENISCLLGNGGIIIDAMQNSFSQNDNFKDIAEAALRTNDVSPISEFMDFLAKKITEDYKKEAENVDKEKDVASKN